MKNLTITNLLKANKGLFTFWAITAAFGAYFCTYAFRKPFTTGTFEGLLIGTVDYKTVIIIAQVIGYMFSKFIGIKIISELKPAKRILLIVSLILIAQTSLTLFALVKSPYNVAFMFLNGLPLGMVWGIIFSFLEGRRFTELLGMGLSVNMIITSGILKSVYLYIQNLTGYSDFQMPMMMGFIFLPLFLVFVWMLALIPEPSHEEKNLKMSRKPMTKDEKRAIWTNYAPGLILIILVYALLTTLRDFRDNFAVEIWQSISPLEDAGIFAKTESLIGIIVMGCIALMILFRNNKRAFRIINVIMILSMACLFLSTNLFTTNRLNPFAWMISLGISFYLPYLLIQIAFFERLIPVLKIESNAGYFVYLCDSIGYLGSVALLLYKELISPELEYTQLLIEFSIVVAIIAGCTLLAQFLFFNGQINAKQKLSQLIQVSN
jgi:hypothetical protein